MKKLYNSLIIFVISCLAYSNTSDSIKENSVDFNGFINRDNSNVTYLTSNNGTEIEACECYENSNKSYVVLKHYSQHGSANNVFEFSDLTYCLNFLIHDQISKFNYVVFIKKYLSTNNDLKEVVTKKEKSDSKIDKLCNRYPVPLIRWIDAKTYSESYRSEMSFVKRKFIEFSREVSVPFSSEPGSSFNSGNYTKKVDKNAFGSSWIRKRPSQNVTLPAGSGKILTRSKIRVNKVKEYTANFVVDDTLPYEDSKRFRIFREKLRSGEVSLHQNKYGIHVDFSDDGRIVLRNLPVRENVTMVTEKFTLKDLVSCQ